MGVMMGSVSETCAPWQVLQWHNFSFLVICWLSTSYLVVLNSPNITGFLGSLVGNRNTSSERIKDHFLLSILTFSAWEETIFICNGSELRILRPSFSSTAVTRTEGWVIALLWVELVLSDREEPSRILYGSEMSLCQLFCPMSWLDQSEEMETCFWSVEVKHLQKTFFTLCPREW